MVDTMKDYDIIWILPLKSFWIIETSEESIKVIMSTTSEIILSHTKNTNRIYRRTRNRRRS